MKYIDDEGKVNSTMKYQNERGISLNYTGDDIQTKLVKEVVTEACRLIYNSNFTEARLFLEENFNLENMGKIKNDRSNKNVEL